MLLESSNRALSGENGAARPISVNFQRRPARSKPKNKPSPGDTMTGNFNRNGIPILRRRQNQELGFCSSCREDTLHNVTYDNRRLCAKCGE